MYVVKDGEVKAAIDYTPDYITFENPMSCGGIVGTPVDMGLSVKWSNVNVGASRPEELGNEYAWGETETKNEYTWANYKHLQSGKDNWGYINKYQVDDNQRRPTWYNADGEFIGDGKTTLESADDAATSWGGDWKTPTYDDWKELSNNTTRTWKSNYNNSGMSGYLLKSKVEGHTDAFIFLPATGFYDNEQNGVGLGYNAYYWTATLGATTNTSYLISFNSDMFIIPQSRDGKNRYLGCQVRPICSSNNTNGHDAVDLGLPSGKLWATCNVGASQPYGTGTFLAWGETTAKTEYKWATYKHLTTGGFVWKDINKYTREDGQKNGGIWYDGFTFTGDGKTTIESVDDVATTQWSSKWRIPTNAEWDELLKNTTHEWVDNYYCTGVSGWILTSTVEGHTSAYIFLPANYTTSGEYWSASLSSTALAKSLLFGKSSCSFTHDYRNISLPIRPVCPSEE